MRVDSSKNQRNKHQKKPNDQRNLIVNRKKRGNQVVGIIGVFWLEFGVLLVLMVTVKGIEMSEHVNLSGRIEIRAPKAHFIKSILPASEDKINVIISPTSVGSASSMYLVSSKSLNQTRNLDLDFLSEIESLQPQTHLIEQIGPGFRAFELRGTESKVLVFQKQPKKSNKAKKSKIHIFGQSKIWGLPEHPLSSSIWDLTLEPIAKHKIQLKIYEVHLVFGNIVYGINSKNNGILCNIDNPESPRCKPMLQRVHPSGQDYEEYSPNLSVFHKNFQGETTQKGDGEASDGVLEAFNSPLSPSECNFIGILSSVICTTDQGKNQYLSIPVDTKHDSMIVQMVWWSAVLRKPFNYLNNKIFGVRFQRPDFVLCQFFDPIRNSTSIFGLNLRLNRSESDLNEPVLLPIPDIQILAISTKNGNLRLYDLQKRGKVIYSANFGSKKRIYDLKFARSSFRLTGRISLTEAISFKIKPRYSLNGCAYADYRLGKCLKCEIGYKKSNRKLASGSQNQCVRRMKYGPRRPEFVSYRYLNSLEYDIFEGANFFSKTYFLRFKLNHTSKGSKNGTKDQNKVSFRRFYGDLILEFHDTKIGDLVKKQVFLVSIQEFMPETGYYIIRGRFYRLYEGGVVKIRVKIHQYKQPKKQPKNTQSRQSRAKASKFSSNQPENDNQAASKPSKKTQNLKRAEIGISIPNEENQHLRFYKLFKSIKNALSIILCLTALVPSTLNRSTKLNKIFQSIHLFQSLPLLALANVPLFINFDCYLKDVMMLYYREARFEILSQKLNNFFRNVLLPDGVFFGLPGLLGDTQSAKKGSNGSKKGEKGFGNDLYFGKVSELGVDFGVINRLGIGYWAYLMVILISLFLCFGDLMAKLFCPKSYQKKTIFESIEDYRKSLEQNQIHMTPSVSLEDPHDLKKGENFQKNQENREIDDLDLSNNGDNLTTLQSFIYHFSCLRLTLSSLLMIPTTLYALINLKLYITIATLPAPKSGRMPAHLGPSTLLGVSLLALITLDTLISFFSPTLKKWKFWQYSYPSLKSSFYAHTTYTFTTKESIKSGFRKVQFQAIAKLLKWPIFITILIFCPVYGQGAHNQLTAAKYISITCFLYFLAYCKISVITMISGGYEDLFGFMIKLVQDLALTALFFGFVLVAFDQNFKIFDLTKALIFTYSGKLLYLSIWLLELLELLRVIYEVSIELGATEFKEHDLSFLVVKRRHYDQAGFRREYLHIWRARRFQGVGYDNLSECSKTGFFESWDGSKKPLFDVFGQKETDWREIDGRMRLRDRVCGLIRQEFGDELATDPGVGELGFESTEEAELRKRILGLRPKEFWAFMGRMRARECLFELLETTPQFRGGEHSRGPFDRHLDPRTRAERLEKDGELKKKTSEFKKGTGEEDAERDHKGDLGRDLRWRGQGESKNDRILVSKGVRRVGAKSSLRTFRTKTESARSYSYRNRMATGSIDAYQEVNNGPENTQKVENIKIEEICPNVKMSQGDIEIVADMRIGDPMQPEEPTENPEMIENEPKRPDHLISEKKSIFANHRNPARKGPPGDTQEPKTNIPAPQPHTKTLKNKENPNPANHPTNPFKGPRTPQTTKRVDLDSIEMDLSLYEDIELTFPKPKLYSNIPRPQKHLNTLRAKYQAEDTPENRSSFKPALTSHSKKRIFKNLDSESNLRVSLGYESNMIGPEEECFEIVEGEVNQVMRGKDNEGKRLAVNGADLCLATRFVEKGDGQEKEISMIVERNAVSGIGVSGSGFDLEREVAEFGSGFLDRPSF